MKARDIIPVGKFERDLRKRTPLIICITGIHPGFGRQDLSAAKEMARFFVIALPFLAFLLRPISDLEPTRRFKDNG
jgi:hypothetical protein